MQTYWLYYNGNVLQGVRMPAGSSDREVKNAALRELEVCPTISLEANEAPIDRWNKIQHATIQL